MPFIVAAVGSILGGISLLFGTVATGVVVSSTLSSGDAVGPTPGRMPSRAPSFVVGPAPGTMPTAAPSLNAVTENDVATIAAIAGLAAIVIVSGIRYYYYLPPKNQNESDEEYRERLEYIRPEPLTNAMKDRLASAGVNEIYQYIGVFEELIDNVEYDEYGIASKVNMYNPKVISKDKPKVYIFTNGYVTVFDKPENYNKDEETTIDSLENITFTSSLYRNVKQINKLTVKQGNNEIELLNGMNYKIGKGGYLEFFYERNGSVGISGITTEAITNKELLKQNKNMCGVKEGTEYLEGRTKCIGVDIVPHTEKEKDDQLILYNGDSEKMDKLYTAITQSINYESALKRKLEGIERKIKQYENGENKEQIIKDSKNQDNVRREIAEALNIVTSAQAEVDLSKPFGTWVMVFGEGVLGTGVFFKNDTKLRRRYVVIKDTTLYYFSKDIFNEMTDSTDVTVIENNDNIEITINGRTYKADKKFTVRNVDGPTICDYASDLETRQMVNITHNKGSKDLYGTQTNDGIQGLSKYIKQAIPNNIGGMKNRTLRKRYSNRIRASKRNRRASKRISAFRSRRSRRMKLF
uniref:Uncharacterized protein n=1 Tax=viral metagenome TaxID=1070528 RepID=A0A6C0D5C5_9ZZZZ